MKRFRIRDLGVLIGDLSPGPNNAITDVFGVRVGHTTLISGVGPLEPGHGPVRTGVTVVLPHGGNLFQEKVRAAVKTINGFGKVVGFEQVRELGLIESPIALTNTLNVGLVMDALVQHSFMQNPDIGISTGSVNVIVGETNDGYLNDLQGRHVRAEHVWSAIDDASDGPVQEGVIGAGTGTRCFGWKGGIGTASRILPPDLGGFTLGTLVQSNFGAPEDLVIMGMPIRNHISYPPGAELSSQDQGSVVIVLATDAPLDSRQLRRLCVRAAAGLARVGGRYDHGSGDFVICFSTAHRIAHSHLVIPIVQFVLVNESKVMNGLFQAVVDSVEEAVLNSLFTARTVVGRDDHCAYAIPLEQIMRLISEEGPNEIAG